MNTNSRIPGLRSATWLAACTVGLLTLVYLVAIIALVVLLVVWATQVPLPKVGRAAVIVVAAPVAVLLFTVFVLVRPAIQRDPKSEKWIEVTDQTEPTLFRLLRSIGAELGLGHDYTVKLTQEANAKLSLPSTLSSRLDLRIGLPLLISLSSTELAFVLTHELGHAIQRSQIRPWLWIDAIDGWFRRFLSSTPIPREIVKQAHGWIWIIIVACVALIWCLKLAVFLLYLPISLVTTNLRHKMEYDADRTAAYVVGASNSCRALESLRKLSAAESTTRQTSWLSQEKWEVLLLRAFNNAKPADNDRELAGLYPSTSDRMRAISKGAIEIPASVASGIENFELSSGQSWCREFDSEMAHFPRASQVSHDRCWWCSTRRAVESVSYELDRNDSQRGLEQCNVLIPRCERCKSLMNRTVLWTLLFGVVGFAAPIAAAILYPGDIGRDDRPRLAIIGMLVLCPVACVLGFRLGARKLNKDSRFAHWSTIKEHPEMRRRMETNWRLTGRVSLEESKDERIE